MDRAARSRARSVTKTVKALGKKRATILSQSASGKRARKEDGILSIGSAPPRVSSSVIVNFEQCSKVLLNPERWVVERKPGPQAEDDDVWLLLWSGVVATTAKALEMSVKRQQRPGEGSLCGMRIGSTSGSKDLDVCTFDQGAVAMGFVDNARSEVDLLWTTLREVVGCAPGTGTTRTGRPLPSSHTPISPLHSPMFARHLGAKASVRRKHEDRMHSALFHWRCNTAAKAFAAWQLAHARGLLVVTPRGKNKGEAPGRERGRLTQVGLRNLGNTCYINAVLQALVAVPIFRQTYGGSAAGDSSTSGSGGVEGMKRRRRGLLEELMEPTDRSLIEELGSLLQVVTANKLVMNPLLMLRIAPSS